MLSLFVLTNARLRRHVALTANLHLAPQLSLAPLALLLSRLHASFNAACGALALAGDLAGVHVALALEAGALRIVLGGLGDTGRC